VTVIKAKHYDEDEQRLMEDPIIIDMAKELKCGLPDKSTFFHLPSMTPRHEFMGMANEEYRKRGGKGGESIGAVARAIGRLVWP